jgi:WD40 repeat protein
MGKRAALVLVLFFLSASCLITPLPVKAESRTLIVPDDYSTIQSAIKNAAAGDIVFVKKGTYNVSSVLLNFTVDEAASHITYSLDGEENFTTAGNTNLTVYAWDEAGNVGASETITFSVNAPSPITLVAVASVSGISAVVVTTSLIVYFKKRKR